MFGKLEHSTGLTSEHHEVRVDPFGRATIEGKNFKGDACGLMGEALRRAIGGSRGDSDSKKPEYFATSTQDQTTNW